MPGTKKHLQQYVMGMNDDYNSSSRLIETFLNSAQMVTRVVFSLLKPSVSFRLIEEEKTKFQQFVIKILHQTRLGIESLTLSLYYIHLLHSNVTLYRNGGSEYRIWLTSLMLADDYLNDHSYSCKSWGIASGFSAKECVAMKQEFVTALDHRLYVLPHVFFKWLQHISDYYSTQTTNISPPPPTSRIMTKRSTSMDADSAFTQSTSFSSATYVTSSVAPANPVSQLNAIFNTDFKMTNNNNYMDANTPPLVQEENQYMNAVSCSATYIYQTQLHNYAYINSYYHNKLDSTVLYPCTLNNSSYYYYPKTASSYTQKQQKQEQQSYFVDSIVAPPASLSTPISHNSMMKPTHNTRTAYTQPVTMAHTTCTSSIYYPSPIMMKETRKVPLS